MTVKPLGDRVLIQRFEDEEEKSAGGIIIPDTAKEKSQRGKVVAVGPGRINDDGKLLPMNVKAGDQVLFGKYSGSDIKIDGVEYMIIKEDEIYGIIESAGGKKK